VILLESGGQSARGHWLRKIGRLLKIKNIAGLLLLVLALLFGLLALNNYVRHYLDDKMLDVDTTLAHAYAIPGNWIKGLFTVPEQIMIDVKHTDFQRILYKRKIALERGLLFSSSDDFVPAKIRYKNRTLRAKIRLKGDLLDHLEDESKWSYRVKLSGNDTLFGMKQFSIQHPKTRGYLSDWLLHQAARLEGLISLRYQFADVIFNGKQLGLFAIEEHIDKRLVENNERRNGPIIKYDESNWWFERLRFVNSSQELNPDNLHETQQGLGNYYSLPIDVFQSGSVLDDPVLKNNFLMARELLDRFRLRELKSSQVFDLDKMAFYFAINDLYGHSHALHTNQFRFYYNPVTALLEPIPFDIGQIEKLQELSGLYDDDSLWEDSGKRRFIRDLFSEPRMWELYIQALQKVSAPEYLENLFTTLKEPMQRAMHELYTEFPYYVFDTSVLENNQAYIRHFTDPAAGLQVYKTRSVPGEVQLELGNIQALPLQVLGLSAGGNLFPVSGDAQYFVPGKSKHRPVDYQLLSFDTPEYFQLELDKARVVYRVIGSSENKEASITNWQRRDPRFSNTEFLRKTSDLSSLAFLKVDEGAKKILLKPGKWTIAETVVIPPGYLVLAGSGVELDIINSALFMSRSPVNFKGSEEQPIVIASSDASGQGFLLMGAKQQSTLDYVKFFKLSNPQQGGWSTTGAVTFFESPVIIRHTLFANNYAEDALNIIRSDFEIINSVFENTQSDAFDADFADGSIRKTVFFNSGNDAIDVSGSVLTVSDVYINKAADKGLSAGEASQIHASNIKIEKTEIAVASKDLSSINIQNLTLVDSRVGFAVFQKKAEFGPASVTVKGITDTQKVKNYLVESGSELLIDHKPVAANNDAVKSVLYGAQFGKATVR
jgi:hypothetical protein